MRPGASSGGVGMVPCALHPLYPAAMSTLSLGTGWQGRLRREWVEPLE